MTRKETGKLAQSRIDSVTHKVSPTVLTQIAADWRHEFPSLSRYHSGQKLLRRIGPTLYGIELEKFLSDCYRPRIVIYNLIDTDNKLIAIVDKTIKYQDGLDVTIEYSRHPHDYLEACRLVKQQSNIDLSGTPTLEEIIECVIGYTENESISNCFWSCKAIMQMSSLIANELKRKEVFEIGVGLLLRKIPHDILEMQTRGTARWIDSIRNLSAETIHYSINQSVERFKLQGI